jgi:hypothetical protein|tara:strand:+ start:498 stop:689 length:192 start_codon:yes stop_codon:yes gene_type:complete
MTDEKYNTGGESGQISDRVRDYVGIKEASTHLDAKANQRRQGYKGSAQWDDFMKEILSRSFDR